MTRKARIAHLAGPKMLGADDARRIDERGRELVEQRLRTLERWIADLERQVTVLEGQVQELQAGPKASG